MPINLSCPTSLYGLVLAVLPLLNQYQFSRLCGRSPGWYSSSVCRGRPVSEATRVGLARGLRGMADTAPSDLAREQLLILANHIDQSNGL
jgi:hypothetical protein